MTPKMLKRLAVTASTICILIGFGTAIIVDVRTTSRLKQSLRHLQVERAVLQREFNNLQRANDLAIEFSITPMIVQLTDNLSQQYLKKRGPEWRLIQTHEFMTYLMLSLVWAESRGDMFAVGDEGKARGLTQIWLSTAKQYKPEVTEEQLLNPATNLEVSFQHFHELLKKYKGNFAAVLYAWNRGQGKVDKMLKLGGLDYVDNGYAGKVYKAALERNAKGL